jgi:hypothetical protein
VLKPSTPAKPPPHSPGSSNSEKCSQANRSRSFHQHDNAQ